MARKKKKDEVENYFNNVANYQTEAEARAVTPEGVKVFCAFDELVPIGKVVPNPGNPNTHPPKQRYRLPERLRAYVLCRESRTYGQVVRRS